MKTSMLRNAISFGLFATISCAAYWPAAAQEPEASSGERRTEDDLAPTGSATVQLESITVTGTRIRGGTTPSPVIAISSEHIREEGFSDLGEAIRSVPQNFTGGQNPGVLMGNVTGGGMVNQNATGGSGLNLRGLGPDASLTLLNGRRMSYGGFVQAVDISAIPVEAVDRVEIVADGASAIYGSDAVGGVANVILKREFDGVALGARYGGATGGGLSTREYNLTAGRAWTGGGLIATFRDVDSDPIYARQRGYTRHLPDPSTIYAGSNLSSGLVSAYQELGTMVTVSVDALRSERDQEYYFYSTESLYNQLAPETVTTHVAPSVEVSLAGGWRITTAGAWGWDDLINDHSMVDVGTRQVIPYLKECFCNASRVYEVGAEGPLFSIGGGSARLAVGGGYRSNEFTWENRATQVSNAQGKESSKFAYAEMRVPILGGDLAARPRTRLDATAAIRGENYGSFGSVTTPKLGLIYSPSTAFTVKASWGKSFKAPTLLERYRPMVGVLMDPVAFGETGHPPGDTLLFLNGGRRDLKPERARTSMISFAFHPASVPGLEAELAVFDIDYTERVIQPALGVGALTSPAFSEYVETAPSVERISEVHASLDEFHNFAGVPYDPTRVVAILDGRYVNTVWQKTRGVDLTGTYRIELHASQLTIRGSLGWLESSQRTAGQPEPRNLAGTLHHPAKLSGRAGAIWKKGGWTASAFVNHRGAVDEEGGDHRGATFTTLDAVVRYSTTGANAIWSGLDISLAVDNLLDRDPPLYPVARPYVAPYDSTNYSAIGRFVGLSIAKHW